MSVDSILSRLDGVKKTGTDKWIAKCPAHDDRSPSLAIRYTDDGKTLLHCFAGCQPREVVEAIGLGLGDLFPKNRSYSRPSPRPSIPSRDRLICLSEETTAVFLAAERLARGEMLEDEDMDRLKQAAQRSGYGQHGI